MNPSSPPQVRHLRCPSRPQSSWGERGSAVPVVVACVGVVMAVGVATAGCASLFIAHRHAASAADLAALAGAGAGAVGVDPCGAAAQVAAANNARVRTCVVGPAAVSVTVEVDGASFAGRIPVLAAQANAEWSWAQ